MEDIKLAAAEIEDPASEVVSDEKTDDTASATASKTSASTEVSGTSSVDRGAQASAYLGVAEMESSEAETGVDLES